MTRPPVLVFLALLLVLAAPLAAQEVSERRVRQAIDDAARGLGQAVAAGSPLTAPAATTGGPGHFQIGAGASLTRIEIEDPRHEEGTLDFLLPVATLQGAVGILSGGPAGFGALDIIGRAGPVVAREDYRDNSVLYAIGARIGLVSEGALAPAISATVARAWVDRLEYGDPGHEEVSFEGEIRTLSARIDVSKDLVLVAPYAGIGFDRTEIEADYRIPASRSTGGREIRGAIEPSGTHSKAYAGLDFALVLLTATLELGVYDGGTFGAFALRAGL